MNFDKGPQELVRREGPVFVIAEAGVNHNGSPELAQALVKAAKNAGADAVKFQTFKAEELAASDAPLAQYQQERANFADQFEMLKALELDDEAHHALAALCNELGIEFLSTPFELGSLNFLVEHIRVSKIKLSSGDLTNSPLVLAAAATGLPLILSTGMANEDEIEQALQVAAFGYIEGKKNMGDRVTGTTPDGDQSLFLSVDVPSGPGSASAAFRKAYMSPEGQQLLRENVTLMQCTTEYPCPLEHAEVGAIVRLRERFGVGTGFSDHTTGMSAALAAAALGANVIEKHFTIDRTLPGPDHAASLEPDELAKLVEEVRNVERVLGTWTKVPSAVELKNAPAARKSLVAARDIPIGKTLEPADITAKRPGTGVPPMRYWELIGTQAKKNYSKDEMI